MILVLGTVGIAVAIMSSVVVSGDIVVIGFEVLELKLLGGTRRLKRASAGTTRVASVHLSTPPADTLSTCPLVHLLSVRAEDGAGGPTTPLNKADMDVQILLAC